MYGKKEKKNWKKQDAMGLKPRIIPTQHTHITKKIQKETIHICTKANGNIKKRGKERQGKEKKFSWVGYVSTHI